MQDLEFDTSEKEENPAATNTEEKQDSIRRPTLEAALGMSRKWDAREAGREVAETAIKGLHEPPSFFLLFSTIHYEKHGGFQEFLNGVWEVLPKETPLIGGTVAGFINNYGCYTRGAAGLAVSYSHMNIAIGIGKNTRRKPKEASERCAKEISSKQKRNYNINILLNVLAGPVRIYFFGRSLPVVTKKGFIAKFGSKYLEMSSKLLQNANALEEEVIKNLSEHLQDHIIFGGSSADSNDMIVNYQFAGNKVIEHSLVGMSINTDLKIDYAHTDGLRSTGIKFKVTETAFDSRIIKKLDGKPAAETFFGSIGVSKDRLDDRILKTTFFYPLGFKAKDGYICPDAIGAILNDSIAVNYSVESDEIELLTTSGKMLISSVDEAVNSLKIRNPKFGLIISCLARLDTLGRNIFLVRERLLEYFKETPFLLIYCGGENIRFPNEESHHFNETFNILVCDNK